MAFTISPQPKILASSITSLALQTFGINDSDTHLLLPSTIYPNLSLILFLIISMSARFVLWQNKLVYLFLQAQ
jgi:hypothetical protein